MNKSIISSILFFFPLFVFIPEKLFAYLDPGTGSFIFQILIASALTGIYILKSYWKKIKNFFKKNHNDE